VKTVPRRAAADVTSCSEIIRREH